jgi:deoxyribodipyrimidine photo-lyase
VGSEDEDGVFSPFWRAAREAVRPAPAHAPPAALPAPKTWPRSDDIKTWRLHPTKPDWSGGFDVWTPGEAGAQAALQTFIHAPLQEYDEGRDRPDMDGTSGLSPHLHWGEIGPDKVWRAVQARRGGGAASETVADKFLSELGWREFNHHLLHHRPDLPDRNFKPAFDAFPWRQSQPDLKAWREGRTGYPMVDAGMRQLWTSGWMHNRVRMITASFLIKHLLLDWREGERWFWDTLVDASPANNVLNWQWVAGSGADASPFFRIFNPMAQGEKFDPTGRYVRRWAPELAHLTGKDVHAPWTAPPAALSSAGVRLGVTYPRPMVDHDQARRRALEAYQSLPRSGSNAA